MTKFINNSWQEILQDDFNAPYFKELWTFIDQEYKERTIYPEKSHIFSALEHTPYEEVKVVILGQDPYHGAGQAHGMAFSVQKGIKTPPSLRNIYKELNEDIGCSIPEHGFLSSWADQGVLLLNTVLTVRAGEANSHKNKGWEKLTDRIIQLLSQREQQVVFILWGAPAQKKKKFIDASKHMIIESAHPSPLAAYRGFFGSKPFSKTNHALESVGFQPIRWKIPN